MTNVADATWAMLADAGVKRCYGIIGDALNPMIDALRRNGRIEFIHVRNEWAGALAAVGESMAHGQPVAVCGTAGPGATNLLNGLLDASRERVPVIAVCGDTVSYGLDTGVPEEINPYDLFQTASLYTGRIINPEQTRMVVQTAIRTAVVESGPTVLAIPGDVAAQAYHGPLQQVTYHQPVFRPADADLSQLAELINRGKNVTIFGGDGCRFAHDEVVALATKIGAPVGWAYRGKQWLEWENPNAVGQTGLLGWGGCYEAMHQCDLLLLLGTSFPFIEFYPTKPTTVQIDSRGTMIGRRTHVDLGLVGDIGETVAALLPLVEAKKPGHHLAHALDVTKKWHERTGHYVTRGPKLNRIRPEYLTSTLDELAADDAVFTVDTGTPVIWAARYVKAKQNRNILASLNWASMANAMPYAMGAALAFPGRQAIALCGDGGLSMLMGELLTIAERQLPVKLVVFNNSHLEFVHIEMMEAGMAPFGTDFKNPNFAEMAETIGITGFRLEQPAEVRSTVEQFLGTPGPALLDAVVDPHALSLPPHATFGQAENFSLSLAKQTIQGNLDDVIATVKNNALML
jgi:pyruvate dehydrogenase (quinone)